MRSLAALGLRQEWICQMLHLRSPKTLRKHFAEELSKGLAEATAAVARTAYETQPETRKSRASGGMVVLGLPTEKRTEDKLDAAA